MFSSMHSDILNVHETQNADVLEHPKLAEIILGKQKQCIFDVVTTAQYLTLSCVVTIKKFKIMKSFNIEKNVCVE